MKSHQSILSPVRSDSRRRAFSLIEVMVAVSLLSFIIVGLLAMFFQVQRAFRAGTAQADIMEGRRLRAQEHHATRQLRKPAVSSARLRLRPIKMSRLVRGSQAFHSRSGFPSNSMWTP